MQNKQETHRQKLDVNSMSADKTNIPDYPNFSTRYLICQIILIPVTIKKQTKE